MELYTNLLYFFAIHKHLKSEGFMFINLMRVTGGSDESPKLCPCVVNVDLIQTFERASDDPDKPNYRRTAITFDPDLTEVFEESFDTICALIFPRT